MRVSLSNLPSPNKEYVIDFPRLDGGLNTWELDYRLKNNESPEMLNLWWQDGALCCRDGQTRLTEEGLGTGCSAYERTFWGRGFFHIGDRRYAAKLDDGAAAGQVTLSELTEIDGGAVAVPENRGSWFRYNDSLYYKNRGGYFRIDYDAEGDAFDAKAVEGYAPIIQINTEPTTAAGDAYQPENRICAVKTVWYSTVSGVKEYHLPALSEESKADGCVLTSIDKVVVDGVELQEGEGYTVSLENRTVTFTNEPTHHDPVVANTVKITYTQTNPKAMASVMDCPYAIVYGGAQELCVVVGGCEAQPNAYFWSGNHIVMDPAYFPMEQYNFAGATEERVTGFGKQQNMLVIFKEHSVGRASMGTQEMGTGRVLITMDYTNINSRIGCDLPWSIQLVENNLVFANKEQGVHIVADSSAAYENNIVHISRKVDNELLTAVREAESVSSFDDGDRYWLAADGVVYAWGYTLSGYKDPSWFQFDGIRGVAFLNSDTDKYQLTGDGHVDIYRRSFADYGEAICKRYRFATQNFGSYDRLKDVTGVILTVRGDTDTDIGITYTTDYEVRKDLTNIRSWSWRLAPRNLAYRYLGVTRFATVARRRPGCRHIRHFAITLENNKVGTDMSVISAQIYYTFQGRDR